MVSFRLGKKRSIGAAGNAASGHKMFIDAGSDFSGGKVWGEKRVAKTQTATRMGGGGVATAYNLSSIGRRLCLSACDMPQVPRSMRALFGRREVPPKADRETARSRRERNQCRILP